MQTIGERLEEARKKKGISIREAAEATKIRGEYLQKFEGNQFEIGLTEIYTRGFLRGYANYLRIPSERLLNDYTALRGGEPRLRQPSREVYGRMDLAISTADERGEPQSDLAAPEVAQRPQARFQRPGENLPKGPPIDPALVFKGGIILASVIGALLIVWLIKSLVGSGSGAATHSAAPAGGEITESAPASPAATISVYALDAVRIKVARKSDDVELFQGSLQPGEHREFQNIPLYLTASDLGSVQLDYKGHRYPTGYTGYKRIQFDFSNR